MWSKMEWYKMFTIDRNEMCCPVDAVNMDDAYSALMLLIKLWAHQPHPSVFIWLVPNTIEPVYNGAWVIGASEVEREEGEDPHDLQAAHRVCFWVHIHECTVIPWTFISPERCGANDLLSHAMDATSITGRIEQCACRVNHLDLAIVVGIVVLWNVEQIVLVAIILVLLLEEKHPK